MAKDAGLSVFTRARARSLQLPIEELTGAGYTRLFYDTYIPSGSAITLHTRAATIVRRLPAVHHVSHHTAVRLWGGVAPDSADVHVAMASRESRCRRSGVAAHLAAEDAQTTEHRGLRMSTPLQAFLDLASVGTSLVDLVVAGDSLVKAREIDPADFIALAQGWTGRNAKRARRAAGLIRAGVDSPMETRLRLLIVFAGLPEPEVNVVVRDADGRWLWRFDLCYRDLKLIVEYDGRQHAFDTAQWVHDLDRREALDRSGHRILIVQSDGIYGDPLRTLVRVHDALEELGAKGLPKRFKPEWSRHFVGRS